MLQQFLNETEIEETNKNNEIFKIYFWYNTLSLLVKDLNKFNQNENEKIENQNNDWLFYIKNYVILKKIPKNENLNKVIDIVEKNIRLQ